MPRSDGLRALLFGVAAFGLYVLTLAPGVYWGDSARLQCLTETPEFSTGARGYPLWTGGAHLLFRILPLEAASAANLFAAICGAVGVALVWRLARRETDSRRGADTAAATLAVSHLFWSSSVVAEVYSLSAMFVLLLLLLAGPAASGRRGPTLAFGALVALCLLHHRSLLVVAAVLGVLLQIRWIRDGAGLRPVLSAALGFALGLVPFLLVAAFDASPASFDLSRILLGGFQTEPPSAAGIPPVLAYEAGFMAWNLAGPQMLLAAIGAVHALRSRRHGLLSLLAVFGVGILLPLLFSHAGDRYIFLLPSFVAAAVLAGLGAARLAAPHWSRTVPAVLLVLAVVAVPPTVYGVFAHAVPLDRLGRFRGVDPRHTTSFIWPGKAGDRHAAECGLEIMDALPPDAILLHRWGEGQVLIYLQKVEGLRPDVTLTPVGRAEVGPQWQAALREGRVFLSAYPFLPVPETHLSIGRAVLPGLLWSVRARQP